MESGPSYAPHYLTSVMMRTPIKLLSQVSPKTGENEHTEAIVRFEIVDQQDCLQLFFGYIQPLIGVY